MCCVVHVRVHCVELLNVQLRINKRLALLNIYTKYVSGGHRVSPCNEFNKENPTRMQTSLTALLEYFGNSHVHLV